MPPTGSAAFAHLLAPGRIGTMELRNRILMAPMGDCLPEPDGTVSANQAAYFEARARGGAALLVVGSVSVAYPSGSFHERQVAASDDRYLPGLVGLTEQVHRHGARIAAQLTHNGQMALLDVARGEPMLVPSVPPALRPDALSMMMTESELAAAMSAYASPTAKVGYRVADEADIAAVVEQFADATARCREAGFDGVELHAGHGYLIDEFLSPSVNSRTDGWGGSPEGRARLLLEVIRAIRARVGDDFPLWMRLNAVERHKATGETWPEQLEVLDRAVGAGLDAVHVTAYASLDVATGPTDSYVPHVVGPLAGWAAEARQRVAVPVITYGRFEADEAEQVLARGEADFVAMGRKLLADPDLPAKLAAGRVDDVRPCIYQYRCIGNIFLREPLACVVNPTTGAEAAHRAPAAARPRHLVVVGGGVAGMETAIRAAGAGHRVTLWEAGAVLGGTLALAACADPVLDRYLGWLRGQVAQAAVDVRFGMRADGEAVVDLGADEVVVATGARWTVPDVPGAELPIVRTLPSLARWLAGDDEGGDEGGVEGGDEGGVGHRVVLLGGGKPALSLADLCRRRGREVAVVEPTAVFGVELGLPGRFRLVRDLEDAKVVLAASTEVVRIEDDGVVVRAGEGDPYRMGADTVIVASGAVPDPSLADELRAAVGDEVRVHLAGDCRGTGRIEGATRDAARIVARLGEDVVGADIGADIDRPGTDAAR